MGLRQTMNQNPAIAAVIAVVLIAGAAAALWYTMRPTEYNASLNSFYTVDDGKTFFTDSVNKQTPFDHEGKEAVKAYVYTCDGGKTQFVAYLEKMPTGVTMPAAAPSPGAAQTPPEGQGQPPQAGQPRGAGSQLVNKGQFLALVRKPGQKDWIKSGDPRYFPIIAVSCPSGSSGVLDQVSP